MLIQNRLSSPMAATRPPQARFGASASLADSTVQGPEALDRWLFNTEYFEREGKRLTPAMLLVKLDRMQPPANLLKHRKPVLLEPNPRGKGLEGVEPFMRPFLADEKLERAVRRALDDLRQLGLVRFSNDNVMGWGNQTLRLTKAGQRWIDRQNARSGKTDA